MSHTGSLRGLVAASLLTVGALASGCSAPGGSVPAWTAQPDSSAIPGGGRSGAPGTAGSPTPDPDAVPEATSTASPGAAATATAWKTFTDPAKSISFDLPQDWIAQSVPAEEGALPGALKIEVKNQDGAFVAALRTGLPPSESQCPESARKPYVVLSSVPVDRPGLVAEGSIAPRVVYRVIQGYRYFGSYGITNVVGGADGQACELRNIVRGPAGKGDYSFGDLGVLKAFTPDEKVAPAKAFDTLGQAAKYVDESSEFANVQRMLMSLEIKN